MTKYVYGESGIVIPAEAAKATAPITPASLPKGWNGVLQDEDDRLVADMYLQGLYRALSLHKAGGYGFELPGSTPNLKRTFMQFATYLLGVWHFNGEEMC